MISRSKMFIVAENLDDSIQAQTTIYDITLFKTFVDMESYLNVTPTVLDTIIVTTRELPFTGVNMQRLITILESPFIKLTGNVIYLIDKTYKYDTIVEFIEMKELKNWVVYQGDLGLKFITDVITGQGREAAEGQNEVITYRVRASEYIKQQNQLKYESDENHYNTDEDLLSGIPDIEESEDVQPDIDVDTVVNYIVGPPTKERTMLVFFLAQYLSMNEKTLIMEHDVKYHMLTELATKSGVDYEFIDIEELLGDFTYVLNVIRSSFKRLIIVGTKKRKKYDYNFLMDMLKSNLGADIPHLIRECDFSETPYGRRYTVVCENTVPAILECCNNLKYDVEPENVTFIGLQTSNLGPINLTSNEMKSVIEVVLEKNGIVAQRVRANGIVLTGEEVVYDILSVLNRGNRG